MAVDTLEDLDGDGEKAGRFPFVDAGLHQPSRGGVAKYREATQ